MIWTYWPVAELQREIGDSIFDRMDEIIPLIDPNGDALFYQTNKTDLVNLLAAFVDENYFTQQANIERCLNFLPEDIARELSSHIEVEITLGDDTQLEVVAKKVSKNKETRVRFLEFFELGSRFSPVSKEPTAARETVSGPSIDIPITVVSPYKVLKDYQYNVYYRAKSQLGPPLSRTIIQMPTGSGKTRTAMELISDVFIQGDCERVVWLANAEELCEQSVACFVDVWRHVGNKDVDLHRFWGGRDKPNESNFEGACQLIIASFQSIWAVIKSDNKGLEEIFSKTTLLVVDEAHIAVADTYSQVVKKICALSDCRAIGLTATPGRTVEEETSALSDLFHGQILNLEDPNGQWDNAIAYLRSIKVMSKVTYEPLVIQNDIKLSSKELNTLKRDLDFPKSVLERVGSSDLRSAEIVARLREHLDQDAQTLLFAPSVENSKFLTSLFTFLRYRAAHIDGDTPSNARAQIIQDFTEGRIQILCNYGVLATGFDAPKIDLLCIARPTKSPVLYSQMIGRGLRGPEVGGTEFCRIFEVRDNFDNLGTQDELYDSFKDYWESE